MNKPPRSMALYEKTKSTFDWCNLKVTERMKPSWKILFRILSRRTSLTSQGRPAFKFRKYRDHHKDSSRRATPRHIIVRFTRVEMKEKIVRAVREKG